eukprot:SAG22_NODE_1022_length_5991_cov_3.875424_7_plen_120_part_00
MITAFHKAATIAPPPAAAAATAPAASSPSPPPPLPAPPPAAALTSVFLVSTATAGHTPKRFRARVCGWFSFLYFKVQFVLASIRGIDLAAERGAREQPERGECECPTTLLGIWYTSFKF